MQQRTHGDAFRLESPHLLKDFGFSCGGPLQLVLELVALLLQLADKLRHLCHNRVEPPMVCGKVKEDGQIDVKHPTTGSRNCCACAADILVLNIYFSPDG